MSKPSSVLGLALLIVLLMAGCVPPSRSFGPTISDRPSREQVRSLSSPFPAISGSEREADWAREYRIGAAFARDLDFYRSVTSFKRALVLLPENAIDRRMQIEYGVVLSYYLAGKHQKALVAFEDGAIAGVKSTFPAFRDLLHVLIDSYDKADEPENAEKLRKMLRKASPESADELVLSRAVRTGDLEQARSLAPTGSEAAHSLAVYEAGMKSPSRARTLNALLPGAGYAYVGQTRSAVTSFLINALFAWGIYEAFDDGQHALGIVLGSLEMGWYMGGIYGAGLAAIEFNERRYEKIMPRAITEQRLFPILMLEYAF